MGWMRAASLEVRMRVAWRDVHRVARRARRRRQRGTRKPRAWRLPTMRRQAQASLRFTRRTRTATCGPAHRTKRRKEGSACRRAAHRRNAGWPRAQTQKTGNKKASGMHWLFCLCSGAPGEIRTPDRLVRSQVLYPAELRARCEGARLFGFRAIASTLFLNFSSVRRQGRLGAACEQAARSRPARPAALRPRNTPGTTLRMRRCRSGWSWMVHSPRRAAGR